MQSSVVLKQVVRIVTTGLQKINLSSLQIGFVIQHEIVRMMLGKADDYEVATGY
jgi:hypothetical protein